MKSIELQEIPSSTNSYSQHISVLPSCVSLWIMINWECFWKHLLAAVRGFLVMICRWASVIRAYAIRISVQFPRWCPQRPRFSTPWTHVPDLLYQLCTLLKIASQRTNQPTNHKQTSTTTLGFLCIQKMKLEKCESPPKFIIRGPCSHFLIHSDGL